MRAGTGEGERRVLDLPRCPDDSRQVQLRPQPRQFGAVEPLLNVRGSYCLEQYQLVGLEVVSLNGEVKDGASGGVQVLRQLPPAGERSAKGAQVVSHDGSSPRTWCVKRRSPGDPVGCRLGAQGGRG